MAWKKKHHATWQNIKTNLIKRLKRAERLWKSKNYIDDLNLAISKRH